MSDYDSLVPLPGYFPVLNKDVGPCTERPICIVEGVEPPGLGFTIWIMASGAHHHSVALSNLKYVCAM